MKDPKLPLESCRREVFRLCWAILIAYRYSFSFPWTGTFFKKSPFSGWLSQLSRILIRSQGDNLCGKPRHIPEIYEDLFLFHAEKCEAPFFGAGASGRNLVTKSRRCYCNLVRAHRSSLLVYDFQHKSLEKNCNLGPGCCAVRSFPWFIKSAVETSSCEQKLSKPSPEAQANSKTAILLVVAREEHISRQSLNTKKNCEFNVSDFVHTRI